MAGTAPHMQVRRKIMAATTFTTTRSLSKTYNELLDEIERIIIEGTDGTEKSVMAFKERTKNLRCSRQPDVKKSMEKMTGVLKSVKYKSRPIFTLGPPQPKM